jgi:hypothetical protein
MGLAGRPAMGSSLSSGVGDLRGAERAPQHESADDLDDAHNQVKTPGSSIACQDPASTPGGCRLGAMLIGNIDTP